MIGLTSESAGMLVLPKSGSTEQVFFDLACGQEFDPPKAQYLYPLVQDWTIVEGVSCENLLERAQKEYWLLKAVSYFNIVLGGIVPSLEKRIFEEIEDILGGRVSSERVLNHLLIAPLASPDAPFVPARSALSYGFLTVAAILDELAELQPLINRFANKWLSLPNNLFDGFSAPKEQVWRKIIGIGDLVSLLKAEDKHAFVTQWNLMAFSFQTAGERLGVKMLAHQLSQKIYPELNQENETNLGIYEIDSYRDEQDKHTPYACQILEEVQKQISAIAQAVSLGQDARAEMFLRELIEQQTTSGADKKYVVKSLCNIAQQCADMFRPDFEALCLDEAHRIDPLDAWTLVQKGDHLKRMGKFEDALRCFSTAATLGEFEVSKSSEADVYTHKGDYSRAIRTYESIPGWKNLPIVSTAIADNLRKMGRLDDSEAAYNELIHRSLMTPGFIDTDARIQAGMAEIAKQKGNIELAYSIYSDLIKRRNIDERNQLCYKVSMCNVLKIMEKYEDAYVIIDQVIKKYPFSFEAKFIRGSILGLIGKENEGLEDFPISTVTNSSREWLRCYYRGLLLFKLNRYEEAKNNLVREFSEVIASDEEMPILRMAAALCYLKEGKIQDVDILLSHITELHDCRTQYLSLVFKLHSAMLKKDRITMGVLKEKLKYLKIDDPILSNISLALSKRNFALALNYEAEALLRLAA